MTERGHFVFPADDGTIMISFEKAGPSVPIETILPESGRGAGFRDFKVFDYLGLADLVLAEAKEFAAFCRNVNLSGATKDNPKQVTPPPPNLDYLKLRKGGQLDAARMEEVFSIVVAYWQAEPKTMALEPGLVGGLWHGGMRAAEIIKYIRDFTGPDGKLHQPAGRGPDIMKTVCASFQKANGLAKDDAMSKPDVSTMIDLWIKATRSVAIGTPEAKNEALHWADYRQLGLVDAAGRVDLSRVSALAAMVFQSSEPIAFSATLAWADKQWRTNATTYSAARAQLKKKRKQGKLNRKRGRR